MIIFDHLKLVQRDVREVKRMRDFMESRLKGKASECAIEHEQGGECCKVESWDTTLAAIATARTLPVPLALVNTSDPEVGR